jgi:uncharacterized protein YlxW (UPF0749 family)
MAAVEASSRIPPDWTTILDEIQQRLNDALATAQTRDEEEASWTATPICDRREEEWSQLTARLSQLQERADQAGSSVREVDRVLEEAQMALQGYVAACSDVRGRLADWTGRAIG